MKTVVINNGIQIYSITCDPRLTTAYYWHVAHDCEYMHYKWIHLLVNECLLVE
jgi:hypothetical protein